MSTTKISPWKATLAYAIWWSILVVLETYALQTTFNFSWLVALTDALNTNLLIATAGYIMFNSLRYYQPGLKNAFYLVIWSVVLAILCVVIHRYLMIHYLFKGNLPYAQYLASSHIIRGLFSWLMIALIGVLSWIWFYLQDQQAKEKHEQDAVKMAREAELATLRQQLQPHFLFNSLNSISALAGSRPEEARKMIQQLSDFLRGTIKRDDQQLVTLAEEMKHLQLYLDIEKVRFGHRLKTEIKHTALAETMMLPSLLLQPLVENAIKFGLYDTTGETTIRMITETGNNHLIIRIENPYDPETSGSKPGTGFGLNSVQRRLYLLYTRNDLLTTHQHEKVFTTEVKIPQPA